MSKQKLAKSITSALLQLGLTEKEIATYVCLLENGSQSVQGISKITAVNRVTIYAAIEKLKKRGLLSEGRKKNRKIFMAESPEKLLAILENKKTKLAKEEALLKTTVLPILKTVDVNIQEGPVFKFFEGADGINLVYDKYILGKNDVINCGSYETAAKAVSPKEEEKYFRMIREKKSFYRVILEDTALNRQYAAKSAGIIHTKFLPAGEKVSADIVVAGTNLTALVSYDRMCATVIEDEAIAQSMRLYLDFMWHNFKTN